MKLFHWKYSNILKRYSAGDIIVMAETLYDATAKAREALTQFVRENESHLNFDEPEDDWDRKEIADFYYKIELDLAEKCDIFEGTTALLIQGSE